MEKNRSFRIGELLVRAGVRNGKSLFTGMLKAVALTFVAFANVEPSTAQESSRTLSTRKTEPVGRDHVCGGGLPDCTACCVHPLLGGCLEVSRSDCALVHNGNPQEPGTDCHDFNGDGGADACEPEFPSCTPSSGGLSYCSSACSEPLCRATKIRVNHATFEFEVLECGCGWCPFCLACESWPPPCEGWDDGCVRQVVCYSPEICDLTCVCEAEEGDCEPPPDPDPDPPATLVSDSTNPGKTRFISFSVPDSGAAGSETALRVRLESLHHVIPPYPSGPSVPFTTFEGQVRWVGPPGQYMESSSTATPFNAAQLQCAPHYQDWSTVGLLHVTGSAIVPSSIYEVENVATSCAGIESICTAVSAPLMITTTRWGDVEAPYNPPSTTMQPDVGDMAALVSKFRSLPSAPIKARALLAGQFGNVNMVVDLDFSHIAACVDAFRGKPYLYTIQACP